MIKKYYLLLSIVFIVSTGICAFGQTKDTNAEEILHHYKDSLSSLQFVSMKIEVNCDVDANHPNKWFCPYERHFIFRRDNDRTEWIGQQLIFDEHGNVNPLYSQVIKKIMTGELYANVLSTTLNASSPRAVLITKDYKADQEALLDDPGHGSALFGRIFGNSRKSVAELLGEATNLHLRDEQENINGISCYVLGATTEHGKVTAWIAPDKGYNALKWTIQKSNRDLFNNTPIVSKEWSAVFDAVELRKVGVVFVTTGGILTLTIEKTDGSTDIDCYKYRVSDIQLNPDFDASGAFKVTLPDGTRVYVEEAPGVKYIWQDGKIVPVEDVTFDEIDKMVEELRQGK